jgi:hypothetical protein
MDKIKKYQAILNDFLVEYVKSASLSTSGDVKTNLVIDLKRNSFQLLYIGWHGAKYIFSPIFHFDIIDEKIWIQCNNTELEIDEILISEGIEKQDIVLGFQPPFSRAAANKYATI